MGLNTSGNISLAGAQNLLERLRTLLGYDGPALLQKEGKFVNMDGAIPMYLFFTNSNKNPPGITQIESVTMAGTITKNDVALATVVAFGMTTQAINFAVTIGMTSAQIAQSLLAALSANVTINNFYGGLFILSINGNVVSMERADPSGGNDGTLNIAITDPNTTGVTAVPTSTNTRTGFSTAGIATSGYKVLIAAPSDTFTLPRGTDLSTTWVYTAGANAQVAIIN